MVLNFPGQEDGDMSWEIRALKNGALQAAEAWKKVHDTSGGLADMIDMWRQLAEVADEFGAKLADVAQRIDAMGAAAHGIETVDQPEG